MITNNPIVVGIDPQKPSMRAAEWAAAEAILHRVDLELVHAYAVPVWGRPMTPSTTPTMSDITRREAKSMLEATRTTLQARYPRLTITSSLTDGPAARVLRTAGGHALMTVIGCRLGDHPLTDGLIGSVAAAVAENSRGPVVVVRPPVGVVPTTGPVLVGLDGRAESDPAVAFAFEEAALHRVDLVAIHSWTPSLGMDIDAQRNTENRLLAEQLAGWDQKYPDVAVYRDVRRGPPAEAIRRAIQTHAPMLLVIGSRGRNALTSFLLGSTSRDLLAAAPCPVAVVRDQH